MTEDKASQLYNKALELAKEEEGRHVEPSDAATLLENALQKARKEAKHVEQMETAQNPY